VSVFFAKRSEVTRNVVGDASGWKKPSSKMRRLRLISKPTVTSVAERQLKNANVVWECAYEDSFCRC